ncbi:flagellar motor switch protein FliM [Yoonia sp. F2084L]|uniref:flagellar motor switch protein FliM n=1 Tax=Yoonia sp. F2084L TaxID=2926419 RepID=UPI001FF5AD22|nr:flagellar motor switch protein FliM [Yoonia sp. F2084L]MCK0097603.1 flagellar motor switch protein FliM [Yoonia sp. F2084L]
MTESTQVTLLRRMTRPQGQEVAENPLTSSRAVRLALTKAANDTVGLVLTVASVAEEVTGLDDMLGTLDEELMLIGLMRDGALAGLIALDNELRSAVLEMQTMGALLGQKADKRAPTRTDKTMCDPVLDRFLSTFPAAVIGTPLEGWMNNVATGDRVDSTRAAGLILNDCDYRIVRMSVDLGLPDRQGELVMTLPFVPTIEHVAPAPPATVDWSPTFQEAVSKAPASLDALLHRFSVPLAVAQSLQIGSVLPLPGCTVHSVQLIAPDGKPALQAKLGQAGGYRAVRLEAAPAPQLSDFAAATAPSAMALHDDGVITPDISMDAMANNNAPDVAIDMPLGIENPVEANTDLMMDDGAMMAELPTDFDPL